MILFPAIDLVRGRVVRLANGDRSRMDVYSDSPASMARDFLARGASWVHVVDLSSALGEDEAAREANAQAIRAICQVEGLSVDAGGGVRSIDAMCRLAGLGVRRIAIGTALVRDPAFARQAASEFGDMAVADVAAKDGVVRVNGWREGGSLAADDLVSSLAEMGFRHLVFTDIARDGMQTGVDPTAYRHIAEVAGFPVVASGGIASVDDVRALAALGPQVVEGCITGRAHARGRSRRVRVGDGVCRPSCPAQRSPSLAARSLRDSPCGRAGRPQGSLPQAARPRATSLGFCSLFF